MFVGGMGSGGPPGGPLGDAGIGAVEPVDCEEAKGASGGWSPRWDGRCGGIEGNGYTAGT